MKGIWDFFSDEEGIENAVYSVLMIAIVVIVALMIGSLVLSRGGQLEVLAGTPKASLSGVLTCGSGSSASLRINHESGDPINIAQIAISIYDSDGILIGGKDPFSTTSKTLNPGQQTLDILFNVDGDKTITQGRQYTIKVTDTRSKQQIGMMVLVARNG